MSTVELRKDMPPLPARMTKLPLDHRGFPVPWFVAFIDGQPDFRVIRPGGIASAILKNKCWLCGEPLGKFKAFVIGPMCAVTRTPSEPPSHFECAEFAVRACPFLIRPNMRRNTKDYPQQANDPAGIHLDRNPGAMCMWITRSFQTFRPDPRQPSVLLTVGEPEEVLWYSRGRDATRDEVSESIRTGLPFLLSLAEAESPAAVEDLDRMVKAVERYLPAHTQGEPN